MLKYKIQYKLFNVYCLIDIISMTICGKLGADFQRKIQNRRIRKLVKRAYKLDFYKKKFDEIKIKPSDIRNKEDLCKLPTLTKSEYREWMNSELSRAIEKNFKFTKTSGSTGIPTTNIYPPREYATHYVMDLYCWTRAGYNPFFGKTLTCVPSDSKVGALSFIQKLGILRRDIFNMSWERKRIIEKINSFKPDFILGYSSELAYIAQYAIENEISVHKPKFYCAGGENVSGESEKILKNVFGPNMINYYGCTEMADFATRLPDTTEYIVNMPWVALNIQMDDSLIPYGSGKILATPLYRLEYPLINYEIGDIGTLNERNGYEYIEEIAGRTQDIFYWENSKQTTHKDFWLISKELDDIYQIRFIQESTKKIIFQVVKDKFSNKTIKELEEYLISKYKKIIPIDVFIEFEWLPVIPPDPNGKIRNMISLVNKNN